MPALSIVRSTLRVAGAAGLLHALDTNRVMARLEELSRNAFVGVWTSGPGTLPKAIRGSLGTIDINPQRPIPVPATTIAHDFSQAG